MWAILFAIIVFRGQLILLDTWESSEISLHTLISMALHTKKDSYDATLEGVRIQLHSQGSSRQCWSRLFVYMGKLASGIKAHSEFNDLLNILSETKVGQIPIFL